MKKENLVIIALAAAVVVLGGLLAIQHTGNEGPSFNESVDTGDFTLKDKLSFFSASEAPDTETFDDEDEFQAFLSASESSASYSGYAESTATSANQATGSNAKASDADMGISSASRDFSTTNIQVEDVDEGDIIKTDGDYIYTITDRTIFILKAYPGEEAEIVSRIEMDQTPLALFIKDGKMLATGRVDDFSKVETPDDFRPRNGLVFSYLYDISDRSDAKLIEEHYSEGYYLQSRMVDDAAYIVTQMGSSFGGPYPMPIYIEDGMLRSFDAKDISYIQMPYSSASLVGVNSIGMTDGELIDHKAIAVESSSIVYMSEDNLYIASNQRINRWDIETDITKDVLDPYLSDNDRELIERIEDVDSSILSPQEKESKIMQVYEDVVQMLPSDKKEELRDEVERLTDEKMEEFDYETYTVIQKIETSDGQLEVYASGKVPGRAKNQFSFDEDGEVLRLATTIDRSWWFKKDGKTVEAQNHVYTLDGELDVMDSITGIAEGETIYSTRFMDDKLYMVTFRQVDPFFVIDLSDPEDIESLGELKIPGYSRYLHPYDKDTIIGLGREATETGRVRGLKISLFDVSDPSEPIELANYTTESRYSSSIAEYEHKAFLFSRDKNMLVIPAYSWDWEDKEGYSGAFVFNMTRDEISLRGLIDHSRSGDSPYYSSNVERSLYIEDMLYTKSPKLLRINSIETLEGVKDIELENSKQGDIPVF